MSDKYAYGAWEVDNCPCPLGAAGFDVNENTEEVARQYDYEVQELIDWSSMEGTVDAHLAERAMLEAMITFETGVWQGREDELISICKHVINEELND